MADLPPELEGFNSLLDAQPQPVREIFQYCLCLMMVESGNVKIPFLVPIRSGQLLGKGASPFSLVLSF